MRAVVDIRLQVACLVPVWSPVDTQPYTCFGEYEEPCGEEACTRFRENTCYRQVKRCRPGFTLDENTCHPIWSSWSSWSRCTNSCGACGSQTRTRICLRPPCCGPDCQTRLCNRQDRLITERCTKRCGGWWCIRKTCNRYKVC